MDLPDIVYLVRDGDLNEELRFSLRSLQNLPHGDVWIAGYVPSWVTNVRRVNVRQTLGKWNNQTRNLAKALGCGGLSDPFVLFNDDFFVTQPVQTVEPLHRGPFSSILDQYVDRRDEYARRIVATAKRLGDDAFCYDVIHTPMTFRHEPLGAVLEECRSGLLFRSVYGNRATVGGTQIGDVRVRQEHDTFGRPFCSTSETLFAEHKVGKQIRNLFPIRSPYEC